MVIKPFHATVKMANLSWSFYQERKRCQLLIEIRHSCCRNKDREMTKETAYPIGALSRS